ncbi:MAG TPA: glycosyltransferase family 4 protein [Candidatus Dormibacteraeota bacterium]|nr:glycosyltransferase family 4 protein [Candidatus Dormibacteraeota bacterium]
MRILILSWKDPLHPTAGGAERYLVEVAKRWVAGGHQVSILGPRRSKLQFQGAGTADNGIRYVGVGSMLAVFRKARGYLHSQGSTFDRVVESVSTRPFGAHRIVGDRAIAIYHQTAEEVWRMEFPFPVNWLGQHVLEPRWIRRMSFARVVAVSPSTAAALSRYGVHAEAVIPPGCELPRVTGKRVAPSATPRLIWLGRLVRTKRPEDAIAAFKSVREVIPGASLDLLGGGYLESDIRAQHNPGVTVQGFVDETVKAALLSEADLLLLPGTREGWGIVAMEAASYGVPVVAYDIPGLRDAVLDGVTGLVVPANPEILGLAAASLLQDHDRWLRLSEAAQQRGREYTWDRVAQDLLGVLTRPTTPDVCTKTSALPPRPPSFSARRGNCGASWQATLTRAARLVLNSSPTRQGLPDTLARSTGLHA